MPRIPEYTAPSPGITAPETGVEARGQAARRIGPFYHQIGQEYAGAIRGATDLAQDYVDHSQIAHGALGEAALLNDMTNKWEDIKKDPNFDPNDPLAAQRFRTEVLEPALEKFNNGFTSRKAQNWALERTEKIRDHFFERTAADIGTIAAIRTHANAEKAVNIDTNTMVRAGDIGTAKTYVGDDKNPGIMDSHLDAQVGPGMPANKVEEYKAWKQKAKEDAIHNAAAEAISKADDPVAEKEKWQKAFPEYIKPNVEGTLARAAQVQQKNNILTERLLQQSQRAQASENMNQDVTGAMNAGMMVDPQNPGKFIFDPDLPKALLNLAKKHADAPGVTDRIQKEINWIEHQQSGKTATADNPEVYKRLADGVRAGTLGEVDVRNAEADLQIKPQTARQLEQIYQRFNQLPHGDKVFDAKMEGIRQGFEKSPTKEITDPYAGEDYANFLQIFSTEYLKKVKAGTLQPGDMDLRDPNSLISKAKAEATPDAQTKWQRIQGAIQGVGGGSIAPEGQIIGGGPGRSSRPSFTAPGTEFTHPADWQQSPTTGQWLDPKTGDVWSKNGNRLRQGWPQRPSPATPVVPQSQ